METDTTFRPVPQLQSDSFRILLQDVEEVRQTFSFTDSDFVVRTRVGTEYFPALVDLVDFAGIERGEKNTYFLLNAMSQPSSLGASVPSVLNAAIAKVLAYCRSARPRNYDTHFQDLVVAMGGAKQVDMPRAVSVSEKLRQRTGAAATVAPFVVTSGVELMWQQLLQEEENE